MSRRCTKSECWCGAAEAGEDCNMAKNGPRQQTLTFKAGDYEHTVTGTVIGYDIESSGFGRNTGEITIHTYGQISSRKIHSCNCSHCDRSYE